MTKIWIIDTKVITMSILKEGLEGTAKESSPRKKKSNATTIASVTVDQAKPLQDGVKDMLVKHHLFSWDL